MNYWDYVIKKVIKEMKLQLIINLIKKDNEIFNKKNT